MLSLEDGKKLIQLARKAVRTKEIQKNENWGEKRGIFVSIYSYPDKQLKGCIGLIKPESLSKAVQKAAISSAYRDSRFSPLDKEEVDNIVFEVHILTEPKLIEVKDPKEYFRHIEIGKDGLIIQNGYNSGLLLPIVPIEHKWNVEEFLNSLCFKAGLTPDYIYDKNTKIWKFQTQVFREEKPNGKVIEVMR